MLSGLEQDEQNREADVRAGLGHSDLRSTLNPEVDEAGYCGHVDCVSGMGFNETDGGRGGGGGGGRLEKKSRREARRL